MEIVLQDYLEPIDIEISPAWSGILSVYDSEDNFPEIEGARIALIGCNESRGERFNNICGGTEEIRKHLYSLFPHEFFDPIVDLGNLKIGKTLQDTYAALEEVAFCLLEQACIPVIFGGSQDLTYALARAYARRPYNINILNIDSRFDMEGDPEADFDNKSYMPRIVTQPQNRVFNYTNLGNQVYLVEEAAKDLMEALCFDEYRYGSLRSNIEKAEPPLRDADLVTIDMSVARKSDSPGNIYSMPTGFTAEDICQLMKYAGTSYQVSMLGLFEYYPALDKGEQTAMLMAEMLWCFMDGVEHRLNDHPLQNNMNFEYKIYTVLADDKEIETEFYKCKQTDRWWMRLPCTLEQEKIYGRHFYIPCLYEDYMTALSTSGMPERWWRAYRRIK